MYAMGSTNRTARYRSRNIYSDNVPLQEIRTYFAGVLKWIKENIQIRVARPVGLLVKNVRNASATTC
jgi:hypothetical protein